MKLIKEAVDQSLHYSLGYAMARSLRGLLPKEDILVKVMEWADMREELQHPGRRGPGSLRDLKWWYKGAQAGAK